MESKSWAENEFSKIELGDIRLNKRLVKLCDTLSESPEAPINQACQDWSETKAAYRFFKNEKVDSDKIMSTHGIKTSERAQKHKTVLALQDTSYIIYTHHPKTTGLSKLTMVKGKNVEKIYSKGLLMHSCLAVSTDGLPLGLLGQEIMARKESNLTKRERDKLPIEEKESYRWLKGMENATKLIGDNTQVVTVCDREADIYEFLELSQNLDTNVLVRASFNRAVNKSSMYTEQEVEKLWSFMQEQDVCGGFYVDVQHQKATKHAKERSERQAKAEVRFGSIMINPPKRLSSKSPDLKMTAIYVTEKDPPEGIEPLEWMLLTNLEVKNFEEAIEKVLWYKLRWRIEMFFKVLKSGFRVEHCRLSDGQRLKKYLTVMSVIAWRLFALTFIARSKPDEPCNSFLTEDEQKVLFLKNNKVENKVPKMSDAVIAIAKLGGFLARKSDGFPGTLALWRGWKRLQDLVEGFNLAQLDYTYG